MKNIQCLNITYGRRSEILGFAFMFLLVWFQTVFSTLVPTFLPGHLCATKWVNLCFLIFPKLSYSYAFAISFFPYTLLFCLFYSNATFSQSSSQVKFLSRLLYLIVTVLKLHACLWLSTPVTGQCVVWLCTAWSWMFFFFTCLKVPPPTGQQILWGSETCFIDLLNLYSIYKSTMLIVGIQNAIPSRVTLGVWIKIAESFSPKPLKVCRFRSEILRDCLSPAAFDIVINFNT